MFIRRTTTNNAASGEIYFTYRLVRGERIGGKVRQVTVLNLGRNFAFDQDEWPSLCSRIEQLLSHQTGKAGSLQGNTQRLPVGHTGVGPGRQWLCEAIEDVRWQCRRG